MKKRIQTTKKNIGHLYRNLAQLALVGGVTGIFAGAIATFFNILVHEGERISRNA